MIKHYKAAVLPPLNFVSYPIIAVSVLKNSSLKWWKNSVSMGNEKFLKLENIFLQFSSFTEILSFL